MLVSLYKHDIIIFSGGSLIPYEVLVDIHPGDLITHNKIRPLSEIKNKSKQVWIPVDKRKTVFVLQKVRTFNVPDDPI